MDRAPDVGNADHAHAGGLQEERQWSADLAEALDDGAPTDEIDLHLGEGRARAHQHARRRGTRVAARATDAEWLAGDGSGNGVAALQHLERVEQPRHDAAVGVDVGRRHVQVGSDDRRDLDGVATRHPFEFGERHLRRVAFDTALGPPEGQAGDRRLERHVGRQRLDLVDVHVGMEADATLGRPARCAVLDPPAREDFEVPVVHAHRDGDFEDALRRAKRGVDVGIDTDQLGRVVETGK